MPKKMDTRYKVNAVKFLYYYNILKTKLTINDLRYLFKNYWDYDLDFIYYPHPKYKKITKQFMDCFNILVEYLDDESLANLTQLGGQL